MHYDIIIIGMGLAGLMAAKTSVEAGQRVLIIGKGMGSLCLFSSTIDVLGTLPQSIKMENGLSQWIQHHPRHPYSNVGVEKIFEALSSFTALFPYSYSFRSINDENSIMLTGAGTLRPTYLIPTTMLAGRTLDGRQGLVVGFKGYKDFYAHYVAAPLKCQGMTLSLPESLREEMTAAAVSRLMEKKPFRERIGKQIRERKNGTAWVGFPAILGLHDPIHVKKDLEDVIGTEIFEIPTLPPSIPGQRIFARFKEYLIQKGATWLLGHSISQASSNESNVKGFVSNPPYSPLILQTVSCLPLAAFSEEV
jgi:glycerol-3-phosphate dehydrogenase subunit B